MRAEALSEEFIQQDNFTLPVEEDDFEDDDYSYDNRLRDSTFGYYEQNREEIEMLERFFGVANITKHKKRRKATGSSIQSMNTFEVLT